MRFKKIFAKNKFKNNQKFDQESTDDFLLF